MQPAHATFRSHFFRIFMTTGIMLALVMAGMVSTYDIMNGRKAIIENVSQGISLVEAFATIEAGKNDNDKNSDFYAVMAQSHHMTLLCLYDRDNRLMQHWQSSLSTDSCPAIVRKLGIVEDIFDLQIATLLQAGYSAGIIYAQAPLMPFTAMASHAMAVLTCLLLLAAVNSYICAYLGARHMNRLMVAMRQQIDCLMDHNTSECALMPADATYETLAMFDAIRSLRVHRDMLLVPKESLIEQREWYENIFVNLFSLLRPRVPENSSILPILADCELLLQLNNPDDSQHPEETEDIIRLVDEARTSAKALHMPGSSVHLAASFRPGFTKEFKVHAGYLRALFRHVLLIGLRRTRAGLVSLRVEIQTISGKPKLLWQMEDSGPAMQQGVLHSHLLDRPNRQLTIADASWLLTVQLTKRMHGSLQADNASAGLSLRGEIPLALADTIPAEISAIAPPLREEKRPPLILVIGDASDYLSGLASMLCQLQCLPLIITNYVQALELAPALPLSAVLFVAPMLKEDGKAMLRRLKGFMENKTMPVVSLWAVTTSRAAADHRAFEELGVTQVLLAPVQQDRLAQLCDGLSSANGRFWLERDSKIQHEFSQSLLERIPELQQEFFLHLDLMIGFLLPLKTELLSNILYEVHAVKSAAMALGFMRIALLMANLEHLLTHRQVEQIAIIAQCLTAAKLHA